MNFISQWLEKIELLDTYSEARAKIIISAALTIFLVMSITYSTLFNISRDNLKVDVSFIISALFFLIGSIFFLIRNPKNVYSGYLILVAIYILIFNACFFYGGLQTSGVFLFILLPIVASFLVNRIVTILCFLFNAILISTFFILRKYEMLPDMPQTFLEKETIIRLIALISVMSLSFLVSYFCQKVILNVIYGLKHVYDSHPSGIVKINKKGKILNSNISFKKLFHFSGSNIEELFGKEFNSQITLNTIMNSEDFFQLNSSSGKTFIVNFLPYGQYSPNVGLIFFLDNTFMVEKINLEKIIAEKHAKEKLIATYNHEINNPLMIAFGYTKKLEASDEDSTFYLKRLNNALTRIKKAVKKIDHINH